MFFGRVPDAHMPSQSAIGVGLSPLASHRTCHVGRVAASAKAGSNKWLTSLPAEA